jgi:hypothetical protein
MLDKAEPDALAEDLTTLKLLSVSSTTASTSSTAAIPVVIRLLCLPKTAQSDPRTVQSNVDCCTML